MGDVKFCHEQSRVGSYRVTIIGRFCLLSALNFHVGRSREIIAGKVNGS